MRYPLIALAIALLLTFGCRGEATEPTLDPVFLTVDGETALRPGQSAVHDEFSVTFERVESDSRCPIDVICVWEGNAAIRIGLTLGKGPTHPFTLNTTGEPSSAQLGSYQVRLVSLLPATRSTHRIEPDEYRLTVRVERVP